MSTDRTKLLHEAGYEAKVDILSSGAGGTEES